MKRRKQRGRRVPQAEAYSGKEPLQRHPDFPDLIWIDDHWVHRGTATFSSDEVVDLIRKARDERTEHLLRIALDDPNYSFPEED